MLFSKKNFWLLYTHGSSKYTVISNVYHMPLSFTAMYYNTFVLAALLFLNVTYENSICISLECDKTIHIIQKTEHFQSMLMELGQWQGSILLTWIDLNLSMDK